ncbi:SDR family oxidoreductase [Nocardioides piscis]|uniref:SDR family oxidoreductase n=1 Tax=Nocardioides piscis TaxID=2714938 RepID=A0A6G7YEG6_9ACTN|nr:SDR family oxidoreductase [Nocardioides piscis]QIK75160.1 SDR family oxidoreductase [Nocardioides piscis]
MARELNDLTVAITGGARGIGAATAERLERAGADVVIGDRDADVLAATARDLGVRSHPLDVTDATSWRDFVAAAGAVDVLVNNAGIMPIGSILKEDEAVTRAVVDVNLHGVIIGTKAVAPQMAERGRGHIINVASAVGRVATADGATYTASKFAVVGFSEATRLELAPQGIEVSLVMPTVVRTELAAGIRQAKGVKEIGPEDVAEVIELMIRKPRPEMWVPRWTQPMSRVTTMLPKRVQQVISDRFEANVLAERDDAARSAYEERVRRS